MNYSDSRLSRRSRSLVSAVTDVAFSPSPLIHVPISSPKEVWYISLLANCYSNKILVLHFVLFEPHILVQNVVGKKVCMLLMSIYCDIAVVRVSVKSRGFK